MQPGAAWSAKFLMMLAPLTLFVSCGCVFTSSVHRVAQRVSTIAAMDVLPAFCQHLDFTESTQAGFRKIFGQQRPGL